ncbi:TPA: hypothetical protein CPU00_12205 [Candidatus Gastranaerophilales bacterium HUM_18]|nr:MAG TPA: hypothetical protein CPU00_12205 [Candidatus Gastranaerophilales bacterium HUM_18]
MKDRAELYQEIKKFFKQEAEPLLKKYEKDRKEDMLPVLLQRTCIITALLGFLGGFIFRYLIILSIISGIILLVYCNFSKNKKIRKVSGGYSLDIENDYEMIIKRELMPKFLQIFESNLKWHKYNDTAGSPQNYNLQLDKLEIFAQSCIKTFDDIIYGHELDVPTDIIETKLGVGLNNISTVATGVFAVQLIPFGVIALIIISAVLNQMWIITWLILGILLTIIIGPIVLISRAKKAVENSRSVILRFKIPKRIKAHTVIFEKQYAFKPKNKIKPFQKIVLEDIEFEKRFDTYSTNQVEARYLLTTLFMKRFENLKTSFKAKNIRAEFTGEELIVLIQVDKDMFQMGSITKETTFSTFIDMANEICSVLAISKQLNLDSKTGL